MARTKLPLLSLDASGSIAKSIVFSRWKGRTYVRRSVTPANPRSGLQVAMRAALTFITQYFHANFTTMTNAWKAASKVDNITPLNAAVREDQRRVRRGFGTVRYPTDTPGAVEAAPTSVVATGQIKNVLLTWADSAGAGDFCTFIYRSLTTGFTPGPSSLIAVIPHGAQLYNDGHIISGTPYFYRLGGCEHGGTLGSLAVEVSATPT